MPKVVLQVPILEMERIMGENADLRQQVAALKLRIDMLEAKAELLAQERTELALWISEHQKEQGKIR